MSLIGWLLLLAAAGPIAVATRANRSTSLFHAVIWTWLAWAAWGGAIASSAKEWSYLALVLTGCVGVAVLGARRPGVGAWNFVVFGLLVVMLLPLAEAATLGTPLQLGAFRTLFLVALLGMTVANHLPTRLGAGAILLGIGSGWELHWVLNDVLDRRAEVGRLTMAQWCVGLAPASAWAGTRLQRGSETAFDQLWRTFRDRFGSIWALRLREQFNRSAENAALPVELGWTGLCAKDGTESHTAPGSPAFETLTALMKRFGLP